MNKQATRNFIAVRGHTLLELMIAIIVGMFLVLGAFSVMAAFEGNKRSTTAVNDAIQSGNYGLFTLDKLIRSAGSGLAHFGATSGWGCGLNYTPSNGASNGTTIDSSTRPSLPAPFDQVFVNAAIPSLKLAPVVIFPGATTVDGTPNVSDAVLVMLGGGGYGESPVPFTNSVGATLVESNVGFGAGNWVLVGSSGLGNCMITKVDSSFSSASNNVSLPLSPAAIGSAAGLIANGNFAVNMGKSPSAADPRSGANIIMYGVGGTGTQYANALWSVDLLNSPMTSTAGSSSVSDDIVLMRAVYGVQPTSGGALVWIQPAVVVIGGVTYNYTPAGLMAGDAAANTALRGIRAVRVGMIVRAPLNEKDSTNLGVGSYSIFGSLPTAPFDVHYDWQVPAGTNYRYRQIETTIPVRNELF